MIKKTLSHLLGKNQKPAQDARRENWEFVERIRNDILARWEEDFRRSAASDASNLQCNFRRYIISETTRLTTGIYADRPNTMAVKEAQIHGWAAHFMPIPDYEDFYVATIRANRTNSPAAALRAWRSVDHLRSFPRLVAAQARCLSKTFLGTKENEADTLALLEQDRAEILGKWKNDYDRGTQKDASYAERQYSEYLRSEGAAPDSSMTGDDQITSVLTETRIHGWAAHFLPYSDYQAFYARTIIANFPVEVAAARRAKQAEHLLSRNSPLNSGLDHCGSPRKLELSKEDLLKEEWQNADPLLTCASSPEQIRAFFATLTADDLHEIAHGEDVMDAPLIEAIACHPLCDWGSAFEILHSFSAASYQTYWKEGKTESDFDTWDQSLFRAFSTIAARAVGEGFKSRRFHHNADWGKRLDRNGEPDPDYPTNWIKWSLPDGVVRPTKGEMHRPLIVFSGGEIRPTFEVWNKQRQK